MSDAAPPTAPPRREPQGEIVRPLAAVTRLAAAPAKAEAAPKPAEPHAPPEPPAPEVEPAAAPPPGGQPAPAAEAPKPARTASRLRRLITVGGTLVVLFVLWEVATYFVAYTDDAYVRSDLVAVAPEITGRIITVHVVDNQDVKVGDKLVTIDPTPFQLEVNQRQAQIDESTALVKVAQEELSSSMAALEAATSAHTYAVQEQARYAVLAAENNAPRAELDRANDALRRTAAEMTIAQVAITKARTSINAHQAALALAKAEMATAQWKLSRTIVVAPVNGAITNLTTRPGDTATINIPMIGIVDSDAWRIMANYKQYYVRQLAIGSTAWVWLDSAPWQLHRAKVTGIARGFSRDPQAPMLLPYVAPTTDWIRLQRRIPVTIVLDGPPPQGKLYMGADARTVIFP
ncbi:MAG: HlyD family secretion protein [Reyranella sp.]|uniref:HlyD family secretion protein n=1 Tax=Reyranella sp. TaxID=1929291 RepID=UPI003D0F6C1F